MSLDSFHLRNGFPDYSVCTIKWILERGLARIFFCALVTFLTCAIAAGATFTVTKVADTNDGACDSDCSLKEAVAAANAAGTNDVIAFDPTVFNVPRTISLGTTSLSITNNGSLMMNGPGVGMLTIDCNINTGIATSPNSTAVLTNFTITGSLNSTSGRIYNGTNATMALGNLLVLNSGQGVAGVTNTGQMTVDNVTFNNNKASAIHNQGTMTVVNSNVSNNWGGIYNDRGTLNVSFTTISNNTGSGIFNTSGAVTLDRVIIRDNIKTPGFRNDGAGIYSWSDLFPAPIVTITNSTISGNRVAGENSSGGGISNFGTTMNISHSSITGNTSVNASGGGVHAAGAVSITNSTIAGNTAALDGGGFYTSSTNTSLSHTTISNNSAGVRGGGVFGNPTVRGSIIGDNAAGTSGPDVSGALASLGFNLIENISGATITGTVTGNILGKDPQLVALRNNSGDTHTIALQPTSPAIDAGDPANFPVSDQRNIPRAQDGDLDGIALPDIGSYERIVFVRSVTKTADTNDGVCDSDCSLREAMAAVNVAPAADNGIVFDPAVFSSPQVIALTGGELVISSPRTIIIQGPGSGILTVTGNSASRVFFVSPGANTAISDLKVTGGNGVGSVSTDQGGGILVREAVLAVKDSIISANTVSNSFGHGGGIYNFRGTLRVLNSTVSSNSGWNGGGVFSSNFGGVLSVVGSIIENNTAGSSGGILNQGTASIENSDIRGNTGTGGCGGINGGEALTVINSRVSLNNGGTGNGGGICGPESGTIANSTIERNTAGFGGGIAGGFVLSISGSRIVDNVATGRGGGLDTGLGTISVLQTTISGNRANYGGGINCSGALTITNSTISRNSASGSFGGGGIFSEINGAGSLVISNATVAFNTAQVGGGLRNNFGTVSLRNTIVSDNSATDSSPDFAGTLTSQGYNLIENTSGTVITGTTTGNRLNQDPLLDPVLRNNGGPTRTHAPRLNSPVIDQGSSTTPATTTDQRGRTRPFDFPTRANAAGGNGSDIGAFERQLSEPTISSPFDFDGDGRTDIGIFRPSVAEWWISHSSTGSTYAAQFGTSGDVIVPADYTGDGKSDIAFWRPSTGEWFVLRSENSTYYSFPFGTSGDTPAPADYDADGKADAAVFRSSTSTWYISRSTGGTTIQAFGASGDVPVPADYDGDGRADIAIFRPSNGQWWVNRSTAGVIATTFGNASDKPVPGDYTGDLKTDVAFWRPSTGEWFILRSEDFSFFSFPFGTTGDVPAPGDYDGDGNHDATVFRPSNTTWYSNRTTDGILIQQFGSFGDLPLPSAFIP